MTTNTMKAFLDHGKQTEVEFTKVLDDHGYCWEVASKEQDMKEHWDISVFILGESVLVDVKGMKKVWRYDPEPNENYHYIELANVKGEWGWLYGKAGFFAFETQDYWLFTQADKLREMVAKLVQKERVSAPTLYKIYQRNGRKDLMTLVKTIDILIYCNPLILRKNA